MIECSVDGCARTGRIRRGWCDAHYSRWRKTGTPGGAFIPTFVRAVAAPPGVARAFFWDHVNEASVGCRIWPFGINVEGYGQVRIPGRSHLVHRLACEEHYGPPPLPGMHAAHRPVVCHNSSCWAWEHVRWATPAENVADKLLDGTIRRGEERTDAKLTNAQVLEIRTKVTNGVSYTALMAQYGISRPSISEIVTRKRWKHLSS